MSPLLPSPVPGLLGAGFPPGDAAQKAPGSPSAPSGCCINRACNYPAPLRTPSRPPGLCFVLNSGTPGSAGSPPAALPQPLPSRTGSTGGGPKPGAGGAARCWLTGNRAGRSAAPQTKECSARLGSAQPGPPPPLPVPVPVPPRGAHRARGAGGTPPPNPGPAPGPVPALPGTRSTETASSAPVLVATATPEAPPDGRRGRCLPPPPSPGAHRQPRPRALGLCPAPRGRPGREGQGPRNGLGRSSRGVSGK